MLFGLSLLIYVRAHYTKEEMTGRTVVVVANLKDRTMAGFKSQVKCSTHANSIQQFNILPTQNL